MENIINTDTSIELSGLKNETIIDITIVNISTNLDNDETVYLKMSESSTKFWNNSEDEWWNEV